MKPYIAPQDKAILLAGGLDNFAALWDLELANVDAPNTKHGGWSTVGYVDIEGHGYFLKKQQNYFTRSLKYPFGELRAAHEFRYIQYYHAAGIPTMAAAFFAELKDNQGRRAVLLTRELNGWQDLENLLPQWRQLPLTSRQMLLKVCAELIKRLHNHKLIHRCFYPKHVFLKPAGDSFATCLIDLEKSRHMSILKQGYLRDLYDFRKCTKAFWTAAEFKTFLAAYLGSEIKTKDVDHFFVKVDQYHKN